MEQRNLQVTMQRLRSLKPDGHVKQSTDTINTNRQTKTGDYALTCSIDARTVLIARARMDQSQRTRRGLLIVLSSAGLLRAVLG